jgi:hypothetical protein
MDKKKYKKYLVYSNRNVIISYALTYKPAYAMKCFNFEPEEEVGTLKRLQLLRRAYNNGERNLMETLYDEGLGRTTSGGIPDLGLYLDYLVFEDLKQHFINPNENLFLFYGQHASFHKITDFDINNSISGLGTLNNSTCKFYNYGQCLRFLSRYSMENRYYPTRNFSQPGKKLELSQYAIDMKHDAQGYHYVGAVPSCFTTPNVVMDFHTKCFKKTKLNDDIQVVGHEEEEEEEGVEQEEYGEYGVEVEQEEEEEEEGVEQEEEEEGVEQEEEEEGVEQEKEATKQHVICFLNVLTEGYGSLNWCKFLNNVYCADWFPSAKAKKSSEPITVNHLKKWAYFTMADNSHVILECGRSLLEIYRLHLNNKDPRNNHNAWNMTSFQHHIDEVILRGVAGNASDNDSKIINYVTIVRDTNSTRKKSNDAKRCLIKIRFGEYKNSRRLQLCKFLEECKLESGSEFLEEYEATVVWQLLRGVKVVAFNSQKPTNMVIAENQDINKFLLGRIRHIWNYPRLEILMLSAPLIKLKLHTRAGVHWDCDVVTDDLTEI